MTKTHKDDTGRDLEGQHTPTTYLSRRAVLGGIATAILTTAGLGSAEAGIHHREPALGEQVALQPSAILPSASSIARMQHTSALLPDGLIMVAGGIAPHVGKTGLPLCSVQLYDPVSNTWYTAAPMQTPRYDHATVALPDGKVVVFGGFYHQPLASIEVYDPFANTWSYASPMPTPRKGHTATLTGEYIVITGGGGHRAFASVEVFHPSSNTWLQSSAL